MKIQLKPVRDQVIVITGATSGIGLATAKQAAKRGASVVLNARAEEDLQIVANEISELGGQVAYAAGDVADEAVVRRLADTAIREFGRIDTWVNNAGVSIYGLLEEVSVDDARRLFDTNYWGMVQGSLVALQHLKSERWRADQRWQRAVRDRDPAAGALQREQARGEGVHRDAPHRAREGERAGLGHARRAVGHRHAVSRAREELHGRRADASAARVRAGDRRQRHPRAARRMRTAPCASAPARRSSRSSRRSPPPSAIASRSRPTFEGSRTNEPARDDDTLYAAAPRRSARARQVQGPRDEAELEHRGDAASDPRDHSRPRRSASASHTLCARCAKTRLRATEFAIRTNRIVPRFRDLC